MVEKVYRASSLVAALAGLSVIASLLLLATIMNGCGSDPYSSTPPAKTTPTVSERP